jgi:hypothetical protein
VAEAGVIVERRTRLRIWAALILSPVAWYAFQQGLGMALTGACGSVGTWLGPTWGGASLAACALAAWLARPLPPRTYGWLARIARLGAGLFALAIAFQLLATLIVPSCVR